MTIFRKKGFVIPMATLIILFATWIFTYLRVPKDHPWTGRSEAPPPPERPGTTAIYMRPPQPRPDEFCIDPQFSTPSSWTDWKSRYPYGNVTVTGTIMDGQIQSLSMKSARSDAFERQLENDLSNWRYTPFLHGPVTIKINMASKTDCIRFDGSRLERISGAGFDPNKKIRVNRLSLVYISGFNPTKLRYIGKDQF
jgi:hypothetical protein